MAKVLCDRLRTDEKCDIIIALTHMRGPNDERLAREVRGVDLVLGGHDHDFFVQTVGTPGTMVRTFAPLCVLAQRSMLTGRAGHCAHPLTAVALWVCCVGAEVRHRFP